MATAFTDVYDEFLSNVTDFDIVAFAEEDRLSMLKQLMYKAVTDFKSVCQYDLSDIDEENEAFNDTLGRDDIKVLGTGMVYYWANQRILVSDNFKQFLNTKDFYQSSPANMLKTMGDIRKDLKKDFILEMVRYSYIHGDVASLNPADL